MVIQQTAKNYAWLTNVRETSCFKIVFKFQKGEREVQKSALKNMKQKVQILSLLEILVQDEWKNCKWKTISESIRTIYI